MSLEVKTTSYVFHITSEKEFNEIITRAATNKMTVFAKFGATWCGPCKRIEPFYEILAGLHKSSIFLDINVDKVTELCGPYNISSLPTFLVFKEGKYAELMKGANQKRLKELIENQLSI